MASLEAGFLNGMANRCEEGRVGVELINDQMTKSQNGLSLKWLNLQEGLTAGTTLKFELSIVS